MKKARHMEDPATTISSAMSGSEHACLVVKPTQFNDLPDEIQSEVMLRAAVNSIQYASTIMLW